MIPDTWPLFQYGEFRTVRSFHYNLQLGEQHHVGIDELVTEYWIYWQEGSEKHECRLETKTVQRAMVNSPDHTVDRYLGGNNRIIPQGAQWARGIAAQEHGQYLKDGWLSL